MSAVAQLGRTIFYDATLSGSGRISCASCHVASNAYAAVGATPSRLAGAATSGAIFRAVPSLRYAARTPNFSIGPDEGIENVDLAKEATVAAQRQRVTKTAGDSAVPVAMVPQGGLFWDGRANTLQDQAMGPLLNPAEMANRDVDAVAAKLRASGYAGAFTQLFGAEILRMPARLVDEAMFAVARYQVEDSSFQPYSSKYDDWLEGKAKLSAQERRGLAAFEDKERGNCAACHLDRPGPDGTPPAFTDYQYEALGVPRNDSLVPNRDPAFADLGVCGPVRLDLAAQTQYCAMFRTPSLRNVATRSVFFHNGRYGSLDSVLAFYNLRDVRPAAIFGAARRGGGGRFDDVPVTFQGNVDTADPPFNRQRGQPPPMTEREMHDIVAFLRTLTDGYH